MMLPDVHAHYAYTILVNDPNHKDREALEQTISKSTYDSFYYARQVLKSRFHLGEAAISTSAWCSSFYARDVIGGRFELGEAAIIKDSELSYLYAKDVLRGNWTPELAVMCPCWLYTYAKDVIKGRLPSTMHNKMIVFGMIDSSDKYVKKYLGAKKYCTLKGKSTKNESKLGI